jgi:hypothetical protein
MTSVQDLVASVLYQDVPISQNLPFSALDMEHAVLELPDPLPVATELAVRIDHPEGQVLGQAVVTRVRESRAAGEPGQMHLRWVEFADEDFKRLSGWILAPGESVPRRPAPVVPAPVVPAPAPPAPEEAAAPEPVPEEAAPEPVPEAAAPEEAPEPAPTPEAGVPAPVDEETERTIPVDPGATAVELVAIPDAPADAPVQETGALEGGEEISVVEEGGGEDGSGDGGEGGQKKRRRRTKKK